MCYPQSHCVIPDWTLLLLQAYSILILHMVGLLMFQGCQASLEVINYRSIGFISNKALSMIMKGIELGPGLVSNRKDISKHQPALNLNRWMIAARIKWILNLQNWTNCSFWSNAAISMGPICVVTDFGALLLGFSSLVSSNWPKPWPSLETQPKP